MKTAYCLFPVSILRCRFFRLGKKKPKKKIVVCSLGINKVFPNILNLSLSIHCH